MAALQKKTMISLKNVTTFFILAIVYDIFRVTHALANCPGSCKCDDENLVVNCGEGVLGVLPIALNPSIKRLSIQNNKIKTIDSSIQFYAELAYLDLSYNNLFNIPHRTFSYQKKLQELHLNHNKISSIANLTFIGLSMLTSLNLRGNFVDELTADTFSTLPKLEELNLAQNRISRIDQNAFRGLTSLRVLYLNDNTLTTVPSEAFTSLASLAELYLGINSFTTISAGAFESLSGVSSLDLTGARLVDISPETFRGLENSIRKLNLLDNQLKEIPTAALSTLKRLEELSLGQNEFEVVPEGALKGLTNLRRLDIVGSLKLQSIQSNAFATNTNLDTLNLVSNKVLTDIQGGALSGLPHLKHCNFRGNALAIIPENLLPWAELETFDFSENPVVCDCGVLWLRNLLITRNSSQMMQEGVLCASPDYLHQKSLRSLSVDMLGCSSYKSQEHVFIGIILVGAVAILTFLALVVFRCRHQLRDVVKRRWDGSTLGHKEREYQKTFSDEDYMHGTGLNPSIPCSLSFHQQTQSDYLQHPHHHCHHSGLRPIPVTEL